MIVECADSKQSTFSYQKIDNPVLVEYAKNRLPNCGVLKQNDLGSYCYLKIHNDFIFELFPLIKAPNLSMPDYFPPRYECGAHISVIYPEEILSEKIRIDEMGQSFSFEIIDFFSLSVFNKAFFALTISSPSLEQLRIKYGLPVKLNYHGLLVPFHITIANQIKY